ncbi:MAG: hypothetical protein WD768_15355 [Phycisphaeraceae bacterium]
MLHLTICFALFVAAASAEENPKESKKQGELPAEYAEVLTKADHLELFSLEPHGKGKQEKLYGHPVLGSTAVKGDDRKSAVEAIHRTYREGNPNIGYFCFDPRHVVRARLGDRRVDFVICFACCRMDVHEAGRESQSYAVGGKKEDTQAPLDKILKAAKVPLPPQDQ